MSNITINGSRVDFITFSDGCENCKIPDLSEAQHISVVVHNIEDCNRDILRLALVRDAIKRQIDMPVDLYLGYLPQARADRVFEKGMAHPSYVFNSILNAMDWATISINDPHSEASITNLENTKCTPQSSLVSKHSGWLKPILQDYDVVVCAPDKGAKVKAGNIANNLDVPLVVGYKTRNVATGQITGCGVENPEEVEGKMVIMFDDICDGGATFTYLAKEIQKHNPAGIGLHITHGIFSKGLQVFEGVLDFVQCFGTVGKYVSNYDIEKFNFDFTYKLRNPKED